MKFFRRKDSQIPSHFDLIFEESKKANELFKGRKNIKHSLRMSARVSVALTLLTIYTVWIFRETAFKEHSFLSFSVMLTISTVLLSWILTYPHEKKMDDRKGILFIHIIFSSFLYLLVLPKDGSNPSRIYDSFGLESYIFYIILSIQAIGNFFVIDSILKNQSLSEHHRVFNTLIGMLSTNKAIPIQNIKYLDNKSVFRIYYKSVSNTICEISKSLEGQQVMIINNKEYRCDTLSIIKLREILEEKTINAFYESNRENKI